MGIETISFHDLKLCIKDNKEEDSLKHFKYCVKLFEKDIEETKGENMKKQIQVKIKNLQDQIVIHKEYLKDIDKGIDMKQIEDVKKIKDVL